MLTHERLLELLRYEPETGRFFWNVDRYRKAKAGDEAGNLNKRDNRWAIGVDYHTYQRSKLAWFYMTGEYPKFWVDHANRNSLDDTWINLRRAKPQQNNQNAGLKSTNTSGVKGVSWNKAMEKWYAYFNWKSKMRSLGFFDDFNEAVEVATFAREFFFGEFYADLT